MNRRNTCYGIAMALLACFITATLPVVINYSRKWDTQFHAAAMTPLGLYLCRSARQLLHLRRDMNNRH